MDKRFEMRMKRKGEKGEGLGCSGEMKEEGVRQRLRYKTREDNVRM